MLLFVAGLLLFLGVHSIQIVAAPWREQQVARWGLWPWKFAYGAVALLGLLAIVRGYAAAHDPAVVLWTPPLWTRHLAILLNLIAFVLFVAAYVPRNGIRARLQHPMVLGAKTWAVAHLLANGTLLDVLLFASVLVWAVFDFRSARRRGPRALAPAHPLATALTVLIGLVAGYGFARWGHPLLIGVAPLG